MTARQLIASIGFGTVAALGMSGVAAAEEFKIATDTRTQTSEPSQSDWTADGWEALNFVTAKPEVSLTTRG